MTDENKIAREVLPLTIQRIADAIDVFEAAQTKYREFGASDTEPDGVFQNLLMEATAGNGPAIPRTGQNWQLYANSMDCTEAADALAAAALTVVRVIEAVPIRDSAALQRFINDYCWRYN